MPVLQRDHRSSVAVWDFLQLRHQEAIATQPTAIEAFRPTHVIYVNTDRYLESLRVVPMRSCTDRTTEKVSDVPNLEYQYHSFPNFGMYTSLRSSNSFAILSEECRAISRSHLSFSASVVRSSNFSHFCWSSASFSRSWNKKYPPPPPKVKKCYFYIFLYRAASSSTSPYMFLFFFCFFFLLLLLFTSLNSSTSELYCSRREFSRSSAARRDASRNWTDDDVIDWPDPLTMTSSAREKMPCVSV